MNGLKKIFISKTIISSVREYAETRYWTEAIKKKPIENYVNDEIFRKDIFFDIINYAYDGIAEVNP